MGTIQIDGSTPKLTIGNATAEDATILFDGNAQDFYIALDDSADDLLIGLGSTVGTTPIIAIDENKLSTFSGAITVGVDDTGHDVKFFGATASAYMLWDESADDLILAGAAGLSVAGATATAAITASGIIKTDDTTEATSTTDGSLQTDGGLSVVKDAVFGDDVSLLSDAAVLNFGADKDVSVTHVADAGLKISSAQSSDKELLTLESTQAGANGPFIKFNHDTSSPADDDIAGGLDFYNDDDGGNSTQVGLIKVVMSDVSNGSENSYISFSNNVAGTFGEAMRVNETGNLLVGKTGTGYGTDGVRLVSGTSNFSHSSAAVINVNRNSDDGDIINFTQASGLEGSIAVSGSTVSYGTFCGTHWSRLVDNSKPTILRGTVIESIATMCDWYQAVANVSESTDSDGNVTPSHIVKENIFLPNGKSVGDAVTFTSDGTEYTGVYEKEDNEQLPMCKISDTANSKSVYGVFLTWDDADDGLDGDINDMRVASLGAFVVRIHKDQTVAIGDYLVSNGDGTAKKQADDILRASTIAKVTSTTKTHTHADDSYCVPCTLHCG